MEFEKIQNDIKQILTPKRYEHSVGVAKRAEELAKIYNQDIQKAKLVGIAHDIAKEMKTEEAYKYAKEHNIKLDEIEINEPALIHAKIGAQICKEKYNFTKDMAQAIIYHTIGNINMTEFDKIIFLADKTEYGRTEEYLKDTRKIVNQNLDEGMLCVLRSAMKYTLSKEKLIHPDSINLMNKLIIQKYN